VELIPDPPCIAPFEDEDEAKRPKRVGALGTSPQNYWKAFATWKQDDPALATHRTRGRLFVDVWGKKNNLIDTLRDAGADTGRVGQPGHISEVFKKQKSRTRSTTFSFRSGQLGQLDTCEGFVNISPFPVGIRKISSANEDAKTGEVVAPGEPVCVERIEEKDHVRFLKLTDGRGWVFDQQGDLTIMAKMEEIEIGDMWYRISCKELVDVRRAPVYDDDAKTGRLLCPKELTVVNIKCRVRGQNFVHLADGRGWVFLTKPDARQDARRKERSLGDSVMKECDAEVVHGETWMAQEDLLPVTSDIVEVGLWTYIVNIDNMCALGTKLHGVLVNSGDILKIDKRCYGEGAVPEVGREGMKWLRIVDGRGWVPEKTPDGQAAVTLKTGGSISYPSTLKGKFQDENEKLPGWAMGIA